MGQEEKKGKERGGPGGGGSVRRRGVRPLPLVCPVSPWTARTVLACVSTLDMCCACAMFFEQGSHPLRYLAFLGRGMC